MILGIVGYRYYKNYFEFKQVINEYLEANSINKENLVICSGHASGTDTLAEKYATEFELKTLIFEPDWKKYGRAAGPMRNTKIINNCDALIAFKHSKSVGTLDSIKKARSKGIPVHIHKI